MINLGAIVAFFSPSNYALPKKNLQRVLTQLLDAQIPTTLVQVARPDQPPEPSPSGVTNLIFRSTHTLFWKENLWNLGAHITPAQNFLFIDADVIFTNTDWPQKTVDALRTHDLIQPFESCVWLNQNHDGIELQRKSAAVALASGIDPRPDIYHPGFAWAVRRSSFMRMGGWYELHPAGGGDTVTSYALAKTEHGEKWFSNLRTESYVWKRKSFQRYRNRVQNTNLNIGYLAGETVQHLWHGLREFRRYIGRLVFMPQVGFDEYPLQRRPDGLLEWVDEAHNLGAQAYFDQRREDG